MPNWASNGVNIDKNTSKKHPKGFRGDRFGWTKLQKTSRSELLVFYRGFKASKPELLVFYRGFKAAKLDLLEIYGV